MNYQLNMNKQSHIDAANLINRTPLYYRNNKIKFFNELKKFLEILKSMPRLGKQISNQDFEIRQIIYIKYRIIYSIIDNEIYILRIIHGKMNFDGDFVFYY